MEHQNVFFIKFGHDIHEESVAPGFGGIKRYLNRWMGYYTVYIYIIVIIIFNIIIIVISWKIHGY